jgi:hypothetical protein
VKILNSVIFFEAVGEYAFDLADVVAAFFKKADNAFWGKKRKSVRSKMPPFPHYHISKLIWASPRFAGSGYPLHHLRAFISFMRFGGSATIPLAQTQNI